MSHISPVAQRLRITFGKSGPLKYTSNLDIAKIWERILRRADLPILYTKGFNTRPRISLAMPLPLGISSECEILDIALRKRIQLVADELCDQLLAVSPIGLSIHSIVEADPRAATIQSRIESAKYRIHFPDGVDIDALQHSIDDLLVRDSIIVERVRKRKRSVMDVRPLIISLRLDQANDLIAHLSAGERGNLRPDQLIELLDPGDAHYRIHRFKLHMLPD